MPEPNYTAKLEIIASEPDLVPFQKAITRAMERGISNAIGAARDLVDEIGNVRSKVGNPTDARKLDALVATLDRLVYVVDQTFDARVANGVSGRQTVKGVNDTPQNVRETTVREYNRAAREVLKEVAAGEQERIRAFDKTKQALTRAIDSRISDLNARLNKGGLTSRQREDFERKIGIYQARRNTISDLEYDPRNPNQTAQYRKEAQKLRDTRNSEAEKASRATQEANIRVREQEIRRLNDEKSAAQKTLSLLRNANGPATSIREIESYLENLSTALRRIKDTPVFDPALIGTTGPRPNNFTPQGAVEFAQNRRTEDRARQDQNRSNRGLQAAVDGLTRTQQRILTELDQQIAASTRLDDENRRRNEAAARLGLATTPYASYTSRLQAERNRVAGISPVDEAVSRNNELNRTLLRGLAINLRGAISNREAEIGRNLTPQERREFTTDYKRRVRDTQGGAAAFLGIDPRIDTALSYAGGNLDELRNGYRTAAAEADAMTRTIRTNETALRRHERQIAQNSFSWQKFGDQIGLATRRFGAFLIGSTPVFLLLSTLRQAFDEAVKVERAQTRLSQILGGDRKGVRNIIDTSIAGAGKFGVKASTTLGAIDVIAQAGVQNPSQLQDLAKLFGRVPLAATFGSLPETSEGLIAVNEIFGKNKDPLIPRGLEDTEQLFDRLSRVSADYAVEVKDIFEAVRRGGSTFRETGGNLNEFIKLVTLVRSRSRESAESIGVFFKSLSFRLQRGSTQTLLNTLNIDGSRGPYDTLRQLSDTFSQGVLRADGSRQQLDEGQRVRIAESIAGVNQGGKFITLLQSLAEDRGKFERVSAGSVGAFTTETDKRVNDVTTSLSRLQSSFDKFAEGLINNSSIREFFKIIADTSEIFGKLSGAIANVIVPLGTLGLSLGVTGARGALVGLSSRIGFGANRADVERAAFRLAPERLNPITQIDDNIGLRQRLLNNFRIRGVRSTFYTSSTPEEFESGIRNSVPAGMNSDEYFQRQLRVRDRYNRYVNYRTRYSSGLRNLGDRFRRVATPGRLAAGIIASGIASSLFENNAALAEDDINRNGITAENLASRRRNNLGRNLSNAVGLGLSVAFINPVAGLAVAAGVAAKGLYDFAKEAKKNAEDLKVKAITKNFANATSSDIAESLSKLDKEDFSTRVRVLKEALALQPTQLTGLSVDAKAALSDQKTKVSIATPYSTQEIFSTVTKSLNDEQRLEIGKLLRQLQEASKGQFSENTTALLSKLNDPNNKVQTAYRNSQIALNNFFADAKKISEERSKSFTDATLPFSGQRIKLRTNVEANFSDAGVLANARLNSLDAPLAAIRKATSVESLSLLQNLGDQIGVLGFVQSSPGDKNQPTTLAAKQINDQLIEIANITGIGTETLRNTLISGGIAGLEDLSKGPFKELLDGIRNILTDYQGAFDQIESAIESSYTNIRNRKQEILNNQDQITSTQFALTALGVQRAGSRTGLSGVNLALGQVRQVDTNVQSGLSAAEDIASLRSSLRDPSLSVREQANNQRLLLDKTNALANAMSTAERAINTLSTNMSAYDQAISEYQKLIGANQQTLTGFAGLSKSEVRGLKRSGTANTLREAVSALSAAQGKSGKGIDEIIATNPDVLTPVLSKLTDKEKARLDLLLKSVGPDADVAKFFGIKNTSIRGSQVQTAIQSSLGLANATSVLGEDATSLIIKDQKNYYKGMLDAQDKQQKLLQDQIDILNAIKSANEALLGSDLADLQQSRSGRYNIDDVLIEASTALTNSIKPLEESVNVLKDTLNKSLGSIDIKVDPVEVVIRYKDAAGLSDLLKINNDKLRKDIEQAFMTSFGLYVELPKEATETGSD